MDQGAGRFIGVYALPSTRPLSPDRRARYPGSMTSAETEQLDEIDDRPQRRREWSGVARSLALPLLIVAAIVGAIWYLELGRGGGSAADSYGIVALPNGLNPTGRPAAVEVGRAAPDFRLERLDGGELRLSDLRGRVVLVNFWASWCGPCRAEMPEFARRYRGEEANGLTVLAVDLQEAAGPVQAFVDEFDLPFPVLFDRPGGVARTYRVNGLPKTVIIDRDGIVRAVRDGEVTPAYLDAELGKLLVR